MPGSLIQIPTLSPDVEARRVPAIDTLDIITAVAQILFQDGTELMTSVVTRPLFGYLNLSVADMALATRHARAILYMLKPKPI